MCYSFYDNGQCEKPLRVEWVANTDSHAFLVYNSSAKEVSPEARNTI